MADHSYLSREELRRLKRRRRRKIWHQRRKATMRAIGLLAARTIAPFTLKLLARSWRYDVLGKEHRRAAVPDGEDGFIFALWHGSMLLAIPPFEARDVTILVSGSGDGDLSDALLSGWGYEIIRGSSSKGGSRALRSMLEALSKGSMVVVTPDGPRGPQHSMNPGLAWMARATGRAVVPGGFACDASWNLSTWDNYTIPKPRARVALAFGPPVRVARDASAEDIEAATEAIRCRLLEAEERAAQHVGRTTPEQDSEGGQESPRHLESSP